MAQEVLELDSILGEDEISHLFDENESQEDHQEEQEQEQDKNENITEVISDNFFEEPESVGSEEDQKGEDTSIKKSTSQKNFYSNIAKALKDDSVFPDIEDDKLSTIKNAEDFASVVESIINDRIDSRTKRIETALNMGVSVDEIKEYEDTISKLDSIDDDYLENEESESIRKNLIYQDFINRGYSKERAEREVKKSIDGGTDIDDAKDALSSNKEYFKGKYESILKQAEEIEKSDKAKQLEQAEQLKTAMLGEDEIFKGLTIDKSLRQKAFDNITKPIYLDKETGEKYTAIQKYEMENRVDFIKKIGIIFTLTDGFKDLNKIVKNQVAEEKRKSLRDLEARINNTNRSADGQLNFASGVTEDSNSFITKN